MKHGGLLLTLCLITAPAWAQLSPYAPPPLAFSIVQDATGHIWMATETGLLRLDAHSVYRFGQAHGLPHDHANSLHQTSDGTLWIGTGGGLASYQAGRFRIWSQSLVKWIYPLRSNRVLIGGNGQVSLLQQKAGASAEWTLVPLPDIQINHQPALDAHGRLWYFANGPLCSIAEDHIGSGNPPAPPRCDLRMNAQVAPALAFTREGLLIYRIDDHLFEWNPAKPASPPRLIARGPEIQHGGQMWQDPGSGRVWISSVSRALYVRNGRLTILPGPVSGNHAWLFDRDGTQWIGNTRIADFEWLARVELPGSPIVAAITRDARGTLFASGLTEFYRFDTTRDTWVALQVARQTAAASPVNGPYMSLRPLRHPAGGVVSTAVQPALLRFDGEGRLRARAVESKQRAVHSAMLPNGSLALATTGGLVTADPTQSPIPIQPIALPGDSPRARAVATNTSGEIIVGYAGGVAVVRDGQVRLHWDKSKGLLENASQCLSADDHQIWVGYDSERAFSRILYTETPARIEHFTQQTGHRATASFLFHIDRRGWTWRAGGDGIYVANTGSYAPEDWVRIGESEGNPYTGVVQNAVFEDSDGSLWFGTDKGILHYTPPPDLFDQLRSPTTIALTAVAFDKQPATIAALAPTHLQGGGHSVQFHFSALHYANPKEHRYRYRLFPREKEWTATDQFQVTYPDLPPGDYRFEVHGRAENRAWSNTPATFAFTLQAPFYATTWFLGSTGTLTLTGLVLLLRRYQHRRARRRREQRIKQLFLKALDLSPEARAAFIDAAAPEVATELRSMLENATPEDPTAESRVLPIGEVFEHRYEIERWIGSGGFSHVYLARDRKLSNRPTAIKVHQSRHAAQPELIAQIKREVATLSKLNHPHIVDVYDTGLTPDGRLFLAMEYIDGPSLRQLDLPLAPQHVARLMRQLADAVDAAHHAGIVHRDLKPGNVLLRNAGTPQEHLMVIDFGLATQTGAATQRLLAATPDYMAPEQHQGRAYPATDVYAMALIAFELLTGKRCAHILRDGGSLAGHLPAAVVAELEQALAADPAARPSPQQFAERFENLGKEPGDLRS